MVIIQTPSEQSAKKQSCTRSVVDVHSRPELNFSPKRHWNQDKERVITAPFDYTASHPGKDLRSQLIAAFDGWLQVPPASLEVITKVIGMLHESSLLIDDVQDSSALRRGFPVAHSIFGVAQTINSANYAISIFADEIINLHRGQGMELYWRDSLLCPSEEDYLDMVCNKTGGLFRLGIRLMQAESASTTDCVPLVDLVGIIFQIRDDFLNLSPEYTKNKGECEDLSEGKFSFPIIHSIRSDPSNLQLINILKQRTADVQVKRYAVAYMESTGSFAYTRAILATLIERARVTTLEVDAGQGRMDNMLKFLDKMAIDQA
ncbi:hypothetical protein XA68_12258 [Ophiocordyceps unilateralis]|uniref:Uncharacterized protein n=1 Tax=Ophiocordyceps unilateralis TaxID=268505 RepID=A0A2A9PDU9_OPHUN|nr:hypothetical protein XA68_12258 [Ophiocordyceps unilateralis]